MNKNRIIVMASLLPVHMINDINASDLYAG